MPLRLVPFRFAAVSGDVMPLRIVLCRAAAEFGPVPYRFAARSRLVLPLCFVLCRTALPLRLVP